MSATRYPGDAAGESARDGTRDAARGAAGPAGADRETAAARPPGDDPAAVARAYLDLWERQLVDAAVRGRIAPAAQQPPRHPARSTSPGRATPRS